MTSETGVTVDLESSATSSTLIGAATKRTAIAVALGLVILVSWLGVLDAPSMSYLDEAIKQALISYGVARGVNAVVSVLQTIHLFGLGIGEVLDPINDLVERYSSVMELAIVSLFIQKVLLEITASYFFKVALGVSGFLLIVSMYVRTGISALFVSRVFITLVFLRFSIALVVGANGLVSNAFITEKIDADVAVVQEVEKTVPKPDTTGTEDVSAQAVPPTQAPESAAAQVAPTPPQTAESEKKGLFGQLVAKAQALGAGASEATAKIVANVKQVAAKWDPKAVKEKLDQVIPQMLNVMALFLLKTLILPLAFLYGLKYALEQVWNIKPIPLQSKKRV